LTPEGKIKVKVKRTLTNMGAYYIMPATGGYGNSGAPDFIACIRGRFIGIECKAGGNTLTALQMKHAHLIEATGGMAFIVNEHNVDGLEQTINLNLIYLTENDPNGKG
jgi:hypothetical protein